MMAAGDLPVVRWTPRRTSHIREHSSRSSEQKAVDAESHSIHSLYAAALSATGDHRKAEFELESALLCHPPPPEAATIHARLAKEELNLGNRAKAKAEQAEALRLDPSNAEAAALKVP